MKKSNKSIASRDVLFAFESDSESVDENEVSDNQKAMTPPLLPRAKSPSRSKDSGLINSTPRSSCSKKILDSDLSIGSETENELLNRDEKPTLLSKRRKLLPLSKQKTRAFTSSSVSGQLTGSTPTSDASRHKARKSLNQSMEKSPTLVPACKNKYSLPLTAESHADVLSALGKISGMLQTLGQRMENTEKEVKSIKFQLSTPSTVESSKKESVPLYVKSETRKIYKTLLDYDDDFEGFIVGPNITFKTPHNQSIVERLIREVQSVNHSFEACQIRSAAYTYYKTLSQKESLDRRGLSDDRNKKRRRQERTQRKLLERQSMLKKMEYNEEDFKKWSKVLVNCMISSEESGDDESIVVKPLPWRSTLVDDFFEMLDGELMKDRSSQAKRQFKQRVVGPSSLRERPTSMPSWAIKETETEIS